MLRSLMENLGSPIKRIVVLCPVLLHPNHMLDGFKPMHKAYKETW